MESTNIMEKEKVSKLLIKYSTPAVIGMMANAIYTVCDRIFIGRGVGTIGISAITIAYPVTLIILAFCMLISTGATSLISIKLGEKNINKAEKILANTITLSIIFSVVLTLFGCIFSENILSLFGGSGEELNYAKQYTNIFLIGTIFQMMCSSGNNILRGQGKAKRAMLNFLLAIAIKIILNPICIFGLHLGIMGSALATTIAMVVASVFSIYPFFLKNNVIKLKYKNLKLELDTVIKILTTGVSGFAMQFSSALIAVIFNVRFSAYGGDIAVAAFGIINSLLTLIYMPIYGINQGVQPIIGYNYGATQFSRVKEAFKLSIRVGTIFAVVSFLILEIFSTNIIEVFNSNNSDLTNTGTVGLRLCASMLFLQAIEVIGMSYFQYVGKVKQSIFLSLFRQIIIIIPLVVILPMFLKLDGIWLTIPVADFVATIIVIILLMREIVDINKKISDSVIS